MMALRVMAAVTVPTAAAVGTATPAAADTYPEAQGHYTSPEDPGWVYFLSPPGYGGSRDGRAVNQFGCGIGPDGTVGCDAVPDSEQISDEPPTVYPPPASTPAPSYRRRRRRQVVGCRRALPWRRLET